MKANIICLEDLLDLDLHIPTYQRPYRWSADSALTLFNDIYSSYEKQAEEYRIGTVILHQENENLYIVDGQQRITTLSILLYCFPENCRSEIKLSLLEATVSSLSYKAIENNYKVLKEKLKYHISSEKLSGFLKYIIEKCTVVKIVVDKEQEAFQFFDSQNSRGKELDPHDLLKSYHLREMVNETEDYKVSIIKKWEDLDQKKLAYFFYHNLYPLVRWHKRETGLYYSARNIKIFKGLKQNQNYNFTVYHKAANLYIEHFNDVNMYELTGNKKINQFQLIYPLIAGKRFFLYVLHYYNLSAEIEKKYLSDNKYTPSSGAGEIYVRNLFLNILVFFVDRFGFASLTDYRIDKFYKWCYSLRLVMHSVYPETVNKYAIGKHDRINLGKALFNQVSEMQSPEEFDSIILDSIPSENIKWRPEQDKMKEMKERCGVEQNGTAD